MFVRPQALGCLPAYPSARGRTSTTYANALTSAIAAIMETLVHCVVGTDARQDLLALTFRSSELGSWYGAAPHVPVLRKAYQNLL